MIYYDYKFKEYLITNDNLKGTCHKRVQPGNGTTDVPCMKLVKEQGGHSIAVYKYHTKEAKEKAMKLIKYDRVNFVAPADYSEGKEIDKIVKFIIKKVTGD